MEDDLELFTKRSNTVQGKETYKRKWEKLAFTLNSVEGAARKTTAEWQKAWVTLKGNVKSKASAVASHARGTGGGPPGKKLNDLEQRIVALLGDDLVSGLPINEAGFGAVYDDGAVSGQSGPTELLAEPAAGALDQWLREVNVKFEEELASTSFTPISAIRGKVLKRVGVPEATVTSHSYTPTTSRSSTPVTSRSSSHSSTSTGIPDNDGPPAKKMRRSKVVNERRAAMATFTDLMVRQAQAMESIAASLQDFKPILERIATSVENLNEVAIPDE